MSTLPREALKSENKKEVAENTDFQLDYKVGGFREEKESSLKKRISKERVSIRLFKIRAQGRNFLSGDFFLKLLGKFVGRVKQLDADDFPSGVIVKNDSFLHLIAFMIRTFMKAYVERVLFFVVMKSHNEWLASKILFDLGSDESGNDFSCRIPFLTNHYQQVSSLLTGKLFNGFLSKIRLRNDFIRFS